MFSDILLYIRRADKLFVILTVIFAGIPLFHFSYVPIWDGWQFSRCYLAAATTGSLWCFDHSSFLHTFLFSLTQRIDPGNFQLIYSLNLILGIFGLICLRSLLRYLFGDRLSSANINLITFCFGLNPVFLAHIIQPSLDFTLPIFLIILLLFLFKKRFLYAGAVGILMVFTKESGFMLYGISVALFIPIMIFTDPGLFKDKKRLVRTISLLALPILLFALYMILTPQTQIGDSWIDGIKKMFKFYLWHKVILAQLISLFVINFTWIITSIIIINIFMMILYFLKLLKHKNINKMVLNNRYERIYFYLLLIISCYFLTRIPFVNNPRYMLPVLPILIIIFAGSLVKVLRKQSLITIALTVFLILLTVSSFRTIDPVSKKIFGTFKFGSHDMLEMALFDSPGYKYGYGRDQLVYNFEFTQFHYVTEKILNKTGWQRIFVVAPNANWTKDFTTFDISTGRRAIYGERVTSLPLIYSNQISSRNEAPREFFYISYPHFDKNNINEKQRARLSRLYDLVRIIPLENDGYSLDVYHYVKKNRG